MRAAAFACRSATSSDTCLAFLGFSGLDEGSPAALLVPCCLAFCCPFSRALSSSVTAFGPNDKTRGEIRGAAARTGCSSKAAVTSGCSESDRLSSSTTSLASSLTVPGCKKYVQIYCINNAGK